MAIQRFSSGARWESVAGYSRSVRAGPFVEVSGTTATSADGEVVGIDDPYRQTVQALANVESGLKRAGAEMSDVIRTRLYVTDIHRWEEVARAHAEVFGDIRPATAMVEVSGLIEPEMLVEVEARAYLGDQT